MNLRDELENILLRWDQYERARNAPPIIDYDCRPSAGSIAPATSRVEVYRDLDRLRHTAEEAGLIGLVLRSDAHIAYVKTLLGERAPLSTYIRLTQGCGSLGWADEYVTRHAESVRGELISMGIDWGPGTEAELNELEVPLDAADIPDAIQQATNALEPAVRQLAGTDATYELTIMSTDVDSYWAYWLDGAGQHARLRLNRRNARFTEVKARLCALHEILGHALQSASLAARCSRESVPWVRLLSVHAPHQVLLEGLAQALPLFVAPDDGALTARVRLGHYLQLVRAELHLAVNAGATIDACARHARARVPFWTDEAISDLLTDRSTDPLLRSYLWAYPAGLDWFVALADADATVIQEVFHAAYRDPLVPAELAAMWPDGPTIGGPGGTVRLRDSPVS